MTGRIFSLGPDRGMEILDNTAENRAALLNKFSSNAMSFGSPAP